MTKTNTNIYNKWLNDYGDLHFDLGSLSNKNLNNYDFSIKFILKSHVVTRYQADLNLVEYRNETGRTIE